MVEADVVSTTGLVPIDSFSILFSFVLSAVRCREEGKRCGSCLFHLVLDACRAIGHRQEEDATRDHVDQRLLLLLLLLFRFLVDPLVLSGT